MHIKTICPHCHRELEFSSDCKSNVASCPYCGKDVLVDGLEIPAPDMTDKPSPKAKRGKLLPVIGIACYVYAIIALAGMGLYLPLIVLVAIQIYFSYNISIPDGKYKEFSVSSGERKKKALEIFRFKSRQAAFRTGEFAFATVASIGCIVTPLNWIVAIILAITALQSLLTMSSRDEEIKKRRERSPRYIALLQRKEEEAKQKAKIEAEMAQKAEAEKARKEAERKRLAAIRDEENRKRNEAERLRKEREALEEKKRIEAEKAKARADALAKGYRIYSLREKGEGHVPPRLTLAEYDEAYFTPAEEEKELREQAAREAELREWRAQIDAERVAKEVEARQRRLDREAEERRERDEREAEERRKRDEREFQRRQRLDEIEAEALRAKQDAIQYMTIANRFSPDEIRNYGESAYASKKSALMKELNSRF